MRVSMSLLAEGSALRRMEELLDSVLHADHSAQAERINAAEYTGRDPDHLVTAVVTGDGTVVRILFGTTVGARTAGQVEGAVMAAMASARRQVELAWQAYHDRVSAIAAELADATAEFERDQMSHVERQLREVWPDVRG
jgi:DNA-binding protein YbaB